MLKFLHPYEHIDTEIVSVIVHSACANHSAGSNRFKY
jgi:hypothetical protein